MTVVPDQTATTTTTGPAPALPGHGERLPALDGVRGLAALMILVYHFMPMTSSDPVVRRLIYWNGINWVGVDLFFVLSGFLITGILLKAKGAPHYFRNFYARRSLRIFPLYYGTLAAVFVVFPLALRASGMGPAVEARLGEYYEEYRYVQSRQAVLWLYLSNVPGLVDPKKWLYFLGHFWSLTVEEHFYLVWPAVVLLLDRRRLAAACLACVGVSLVGRIVTASTGGLFFCYIFTPLRMDGLAVGALLAVLAGDGAGVSRAVRPALWAGAAAVAGLAAGFAHDGTLHSYSTFASTLGFTLTAVACGAFLVVVLAAPASSLLGRVMAGGVLRFFGKYSYALYVFNRFLMLPCKRFFPAEKLGRWLGSPLLGALAHVALGVLVTSACAVLSWHLYEKHFLRLKVYFSERPAGAGGLPAQTARKNEA